jgi:hypothetical protein
MGYEVLEDIRGIAADLHAEKVFKGVNWLPPIM